MPKSFVYIEISTEHMIRSILQRLPIPWIVETRVQLCSPPKRPDNRVDDYRTPYRFPSSGLRLNDIPGVELFIRRTIL